MKKLTRTLLPLLLLAFVLTSCAGQMTNSSSFIQDAFKTLTISKTTYDSTLLMAGSLYRQDIISEDQVDKVIEYGYVYMYTHNEAVSALLEYKSSKLVEDKDAYLKLMIDVSARLSKVVGYMKPFILKGGELGDAQ